MVRLERAYHERHTRLLPNSGSHRRDRIRAPAARRRSHDAYPHDLSRSHQRLRKEVRKAMRPVAAGALLALTLAPCVSAHRLDEYLQATLIGLRRDGVDV